MATIDNSDDGYPEARRCHGTVQVLVGNHDLLLQGNIVRSETMHLWSAATMVTMSLAMPGGLTSFPCSGEGFAFISSLEGVWD